MAIQDIIIEMVAGDDSPTITFPITREDGSIVILTGATVTFRILSPVTNLRTNDSSNTCTIIDAIGGICEYDWNATDVPDPGVYQARLRVTHANGKRETAKVRIEVYPDV